MEHNSELVYEGKLIHETTYPQRSERYTEIELDGIKIDYFDARNKVIHEIKKSESHEEAHEWQLKYYLYVLENNGIENPSGILEYPKQRIRKEITLTNEDRKEIEKMKLDIPEITSAPGCPPTMARSKCRNCSYFDFCWSGEEPV